LHYFTRRIRGREWKNSFFLTIGLFKAASTAWHLNFVTKGADFRAVSD